MPRDSMDVVAGNVAVLVGLTIRPSRPFTTAGEASVVLGVSQRYATRILHAMARVGMLERHRAIRANRAGSEPIEFRLSQPFRSAMMAVAAAAVTTTATANTERGEQ